ncbi:MAG TPA: hypothetical protein VKV18_09145 [Chthonomonas sp.]|uniref:hypothetical protein n=1 Tax=Chthonomonas sp. TaxID=2282153 RepID=UPI002B4B8354|nr:hypothetical protein [Chthonomonas sp.]HLI48839.1 hypothetical protein [Chthonomonas sp.]
MLSFFLLWVLPILLGIGAQWVSGKCRGRNAQKAFRYLGWGFWLLLLWALPLGRLIPFFPGFLEPLLLPIKLIPSAILFILAGNSILKEMRAQQRGEYTDPAV